jgi:hypothetical protein
MRDRIGKTGVTSKDDLKSKAIGACDGSRNASD